MLCSYESIIDQSTLPFLLLSLLLCLLQNNQAGVTEALVNVGVVQVY